MLANLIGQIIGDYITGQDSASSTLENFSALFGEVFDFLFNFIFVDCFDFLLKRGDDAFNLLYSRVYSSLNTGEFISAIIGILIFMPILKLVINLIRG